MATIGARLARVVAGEIEIRVPFRPELTQQHGFLHAGDYSGSTPSAAVNPPDTGDDIGDL